MAGILDAAGPHRDRALHAGRLDREAVRQQLRRSHFALLPSRVDNFPNAVAEAMASGCIVIGTRHSSIDEMVEEGTTGFLCDPADPSKLSAAMERAMALGEGERRQMSERASQHIADLCGDRAIEALLECYRSAVAQGRPVPLGSGRRRSR